MTRDDLVERLANSVMMLSAENRNVAGRMHSICEHLHSATEAMLAAKREVHDLASSLDSHQHEMRAALGKIGERLAVIAKQTDDAEKAAGAAASEAKATREATGARGPTVAHEGHAGLLRAFGELPQRTQLLIGVVVVALPAAGAVAHWLVSILSK
jgi:hypothetical protein